MANLADLVGARPVKMFGCGYPGTGKTGSLVSLVNAGYKVRILSYDGNIDPILAFADPAMLKNVDVIVCQDKLRSGPSKIIPSGVPKAFAQGLAMLDHWKYNIPNPSVVPDQDRDDVEIDLGHPREWGPDTILVIDPLTYMGWAAMRRVLALNTRSDKNPRKNDWLAAMKDQEAMIEMLADERMTCSVIVFAHLKMVGPKEEEEQDSGELKTTKDKIQQVVPFRLFPSALGRALPPEIGGHFPIQLLYEVKASGKRVISCHPREDVDIKVPIPGVKRELPIESGLLEIFTALRGAEQPAE